MPTEHSTYVKGAKYTLRLVNKGSSLLRQSLMGEETNGDGLERTVPRQETTSPSLEAG